MKKTDFGLKILTVIREKGWDQRRLAREAEIVESTLSNYIANKTSPKLDALIRLARVLDKPVSYFTDDEKVVLREHNASFSRPYRIPVFDSASSRAVNWEDGTCPAGDYPLTEAADGRDVNAFFLVAQGERLTGRADEHRSVFAGDLLLIEPGRKILDGDLVVCRDENHEPVLKKYRSLPDRIVLLPLNDRNDPVILEPGSSLRCFKVTELRRKI